MDGYVEANGLRVHYLDHGGSGPLMVLLPGLSANAHFFDAIAADGLSAAARVIALDLRGRGETERPTTGFGLEEHARDVLGVLDGLGLDRPVLGGHSYGAALTYYLAINHPDRFDRYVVFDPPLLVTEATLEAIKPSLSRLANPRPDLATYVEHVKAMPYFEGWEWDSRLEGFYRAEIRQRSDGSVVARPDPDDMLAVFESLVGVDWLARPEALRQPFLFLRARDGFGPPGSPPATTEQDLERARAAHRDLTVAEFDGNHITFMWEPVAASVAAAVASFVKRA